jgi:RecG-like helicase
MGVLRRFLSRIAETDEERLAGETRGWAAGIAGAVPLSEAPARQRVKVAGVIRRLTVLPMADHEALEALVFDGTGEIVVRFMGRRGIRGLTLGTRVVVEGVLSDERGRKRMINPRLELTT